MSRRDATSLVITAPRARADELQAETAVHVFYSCLVNYLIPDAALLTSSIDCPHARLAGKYSLSRHVNSHRGQANTFHLVRPSRRASASPGISLLLLLHLLAPASRLLPLRLLLMPQYFGHWAAAAAAAVQAQASASKALRSAHTQCILYSVSCSCLPQHCLGHPDHGAKTYCNMCSLTFIALCSRRSYAHIIIIYTCWRQHSFHGQLDDCMQDCRKRIS